MNANQDTANLTSLVNASDGLMSPSNTLIKEEEVLFAGNRVKVGLIHKNFVAHKFIQMTPICVWVPVIKAIGYLAKIWKRQNQ